MKTNTRIKGGILAAVGLLVAAGNLLAASLTVSPSVITNDYVGKITLTISGLTAGQTVLVERFADLNGNGTVDAGEPLFRSASVTDGQVPRIGGVRNSNVPGDEDGATNGQVRVEFNYPGVDRTLDSIASKCLFRVSDPLSGFAAVIQPFEIRQKVLPQGISGKLVSSGNGLPLPNTVVILTSFNGPGGVGAVTDASGNYLLYIAPGNYTLLAPRPGFVGDLAAGSVTIVTNVILAQNLTNVVADRTISGRVSDSVSGVGIPGTVTASSTNNLFSVAFYDSSGNYVMPAVASQWKVRNSSSSSEQQGYVRVGNSVTANTAVGSVANVNFQLTKADALVYGTIRDPQNNPVAAIGIYGNDNANTYSASGKSDVNGNYSVGMLAGPVNIGVDSSSLAPLGYVSSQGVNVTLTSGQAYAANFTLQRFTAHLIGRVVDATNGPIANVEVNAYPNGGGAGQRATTDANGNFDVGVTAGTWNLQLNNNSSLTQLGLVSPQLSFNVLDGVNQSGITLVVQRVTAQINGVVANNMGVPISGVYVIGSITFNGTNYQASATTDGSGNYSLGVFNGTGWNVFVEQNSINSRGYNTPPSQQVNVSGGNLTVNFSASQIGAPQITTTSLSGGVVSSSYNAQLQATGGQSPYNWSLVASSLPPGLILSSGGFISGTPTSAGTFNFTVRVTNNGSRTTDQPLAIIIAPPGPLGITTSSLPNGTSGSTYTTQLAAAGGATPYVWSLSQGSAPLPPGLSVAATGIISGTPTAAGTYNFLVHIVDALSGTDDRLLTIGINPGLQITTTTLAAGSVNSAYNSQLQATGGVFPYSWSVVSGTLPAGLTLLSGGSLSGTPTTSGTNSFTVRVTDNSANQMDRILSLVITPLLTVTTTSLSNAVVGVAYSVPLQATGGSPPYAWSLATGSAALPTGFTLNSAGSLSGTASATGTNNFIVQVTDSQSRTKIKSLTLVRVAASVPATLGSPSRPSAGHFQFLLGGTPGQNYTVQYSANLAGANWLALVTTNAPSGSFAITDSTATNSYRFYRVVLTP